MTFLIAGGSGFLGTALARALRADGHRASILTRRPQRDGYNGGARGTRARRARTWERDPIAPQPIRRRRNGDGAYRLDERSARLGLRDGAI